MTVHVMQAGKAAVSYVANDNGFAEPRDWASQGRCVGRDPDELFVTGAAQRIAAKLCNGCPVRLQCLSDALDNRVEFGVWGGLTERQRRGLLRQRPDVTDWQDFLLNAGQNRDQQAS